MSLILEALRKIERDRPQKGQGEGVVLLAPRAWPDSASSRGRRAALITAGLFLVLLAVAVGFWIARPHAPASAAGAASQPAPAPPAANVAVPSAPAATTASAAQVVRLPSAPPARHARTVPSSATPTPGTEATPAFVLTAIGDRDGLRIAILNDRVVRVGDAIDGKRIVAITDTHVELELPDGRRLSVGF